MKISKRSAKVLLPILALAFAGATSPAIADSSDAQKSGVIYNSVISPLPGNLPSYGFESVAFNELGNAVNFATTGNHKLSKVVVTMSSWACVTGGWSFDSRNPNTYVPCNTPEDATFSQPITLNVYSPSSDGGSHPGSKIVSVTKTFDIKYRPSASSKCVGDNFGKWYDEESKTCFNGLAQNITFNLNDVLVGSSAIFGIAYNTSTSGYLPIGAAPCRSTYAGCPYDSLNVALTQDPTNVTSGSSVDIGKAWFASPLSSNYADNGAAGVGTFRLDSPGFDPAWGVGAVNAAPWYVPAFKVFATGDGKTSAHSSEKPSSGKATESTSDGKHGIKKD